MKTLRLIANIFTLICSMTMITSCKRVLDIEPPLDKYTVAEVYSKPASAIAAMTGIYDIMSNNGAPFVGSGGINIQTGVLSDELSVVNGSSFTPLYQNSENIYDRTAGIWNSSYKNLIFRINSIIEGVSKSTSLPTKLKLTLVAEAKFTRAFVNFHLLNLYGDIPLVLSTDFRLNAVVKRIGTDEVYAQITKDLLEAQENLSENYLSADLVSSSQERVRPNKGTATALLSRVYLYTNQYALASQEASRLIDRKDIYSLQPLNDIFLKNSREAIWQLQPDPNNQNGTRINTPDANEFLPLMNSATGLYDSPYNFAASDYLIDAFEPNDQRRASWIKEIKTASGSTFLVPFKYKIGTNTGNFTEQLEYTMMFRLAEQYLIRSECRVHTGDLTGALSDLNIIRNRAGLPEVSLTDETLILSKLARERYLELFTEGHRWYDLKRTMKIDERMTVVTQKKGGTWAPFKALLPVPLTEFKTNPSLIGRQNPGYREL